MGALLEDGVFLKEVTEEGGLIPRSTTLRLLVLISLMWLLAVERTRRRFNADGDFGDVTFEADSEPFFALFGVLTFLATTVGVFFWLGGDLALEVFLAGEVLAEVGAFFFFAGDFASGVFLRAGDLAVGVFTLPADGVLGGLCTVSLGADLGGFFTDFLALFGGGGAEGVAVDGDAVFFDPVFTFGVVVAVVPFFLAGEPGDFGESLGEAADGFFLSGFFLGEESSFPAAGDLMWTEDLLLGAGSLFFWLRVRDLPRTNWDSLFERDVALLFGGEGVAFAGDRGRFLAGVFLRDDSGGACGDAVLL